MSAPLPPNSDRPSSAAMLSTDPAGGSALQDQAGQSHRPGLRHLGTTQLRARTGASSTENINDYLDIFQELQVDPMYHSIFWTSVIYRYRQSSRHLPLLKRGTEKSIRQMSDDILRAYGVRIWGAVSTWRSELVDGEEMLLYEKDGQDTRLHEILEKMWWRMRELVFEEKPPPTRGGRSHKRQSAGRASGGGDETDAADIDDNGPMGSDSEVAAATSPFKIARAKAMTKLSKLKDKFPSPGPEEYLSSEQTEGEIMSIIERLHELRLASHPDTFECLWSAHIGRVEEIEDDAEAYEIVPSEQHVKEGGNPLEATPSDVGEQQADDDVVMQDEISTPAGVSAVSQAVPFPTQLLSDEAIRKRVYPNHSSEPFNSSGNIIPPSMTQQHRLRPTVPQVMSIWIMSWPPRAPHVKRAYQHPSAPVQLQDMASFFGQVMARAEHIAEQDIKGYAISYGWCDISRWIEKTVETGCRGVGDGKKAGSSEGERVGWEIFQKDLVEAAKSGVMIWRMKVLVVAK